MSSHQYVPGDKITIKSCPVLGNAEDQAVVVSCESWGYYVTDSMGWTGPVDFELFPLQEG